MTTDPSVIQHDASLQEPMADERILKVTGVDAAQALNYVSAEAIGLPFFYNSFTYPRTFYRSNSRPELERFIGQHVDTHACSADRLQQCVCAVADYVPHYTMLGWAGPKGEARTEEQILKAEAGWCNEQGRLLVGILQICNLPSRLVFASSRHRGGHVMVEAYVDKKWILVDQSFAFVFHAGDRIGLNVLDVKRSSETASQVNEVYREQIGTMRQQVEDRLGAEVANEGMFDKWAGASYPLQILDHVGYHNYFIH